MDVEEFLHRLHFQVDKASPADWEVNWKDAPLAYKLYVDLPKIPLSGEVPLSLQERKFSARPTIHDIGHFLWYVYGLTQYSQSTFDTGEALDTMQSYRRFVPSGGALYPNELYVYLKVENLPVGIYHYDVAHHSLVLLREGNFDVYITKALGNRCDMSTCFGTVFVSTMFWKNFFKYNNFSYRLQGLDAGVVIGQLLETAKCFGFTSGVFFQFLDRAVNHLLGLSEEEESVYGVILLSSQSNSCFTNKGDCEHVSAVELCQELEVVQHRHYIRSKQIREYPMLIKMNKAAMLASTNLFSLNNRGADENDSSQVITLPSVKGISYDFASICKERYSPDADFTLGRISQVQLATLLQETMASFSYESDLGSGRHDMSLSLCLYDVEGILDGAYDYDHRAHGLRRLCLGDQRHQLQAGMSLGNVDLLQVPLCLHVAGDKNHLKKTLGYRGYRIQQMEAGMLVQRLLLVAAAMGMGGHPLLGFDVNVCDKIYKMDRKGKTSFIQIPIGPYRHRQWLRGSLHS